MAQLPVDKSQYIRFIDIAVLGPLMIYWGYTGKLNKFNRALLFGFGVSTIVYNARNFYLNFNLTDIIANANKNAPDLPLIPTNNGSVGVRG